MIVLLDSKTVFTNNIKMLLGKPYLASNSSTRQTYFWKMNLKSWIALELGAYLSSDLPCISVLKG